MEARRLFNKKIDISLSKKGVIIITEHIAKMKYVDVNKTSYDKIFKFYTYKVVDNGKLILAWWSPTPGDTIPTKDYRIYLYDYSDQLDDSYVGLACRPSNHHHHIVLIFNTIEENKYELKYAYRNDVIYDIETEGKNLVIDNNLKVLSTTVLKTKSITKYLKNIFNKISNFFKLN